MKTPSTRKTKARDLRPRTETGSQITKGSRVLMKDGVWEVLAVRRTSETLLELLLEWEHGGTHRLPIGQGQEFDEVDT